MSNYLLKNGRYNRPTQQITEEIIPIFGIVKAVNFNTKNCTIFDIETQTNYSCGFDGFLPVAETDAIAGFVSKMGNSYKFVKKPLVKISTDKDTIINSICKGLKYQIKPTLGEKIYTALLIEAKGESVDDFLDELAINLQEKQIEDFSVLPDYLNEQQVLKLLRWWYKSRTLRKLYLLGLNNLEIKESEKVMGLSPSKIYDHCLVDPFKIIPIPIDKCKSIYDLIGRKYDDGQLYRAFIVRKLYDNVVNRAWIGTPSKYIIDQFKNIDKIMMEKLREEYAVHGEMHTLYLDFHYRVESTMAEVYANLIKKDRNNSTSSGSDSSNRIVPLYFNPKSTVEQKLAVERSLNDHLSIISGGPGTGKTTVISDVIINLEKLNIPYAVASFTGKAVARLKEVLKKSTPSTLHMMITHKDRVTPFKALIIDEVSMVTTELLFYFVKAFGADFRLILVGDVDQLQPISYGNMFSEVIKSGCVQPTYLTKNHRCDIEGMENNELLYNIQLLVNHYYRIKNKEPDEFIENIEFKTGNNFFKLEGNMDSLLGIVKYLADNAIKATDIMVISPYVKYLDEINRGCQKIFNSGTSFVVCPRATKWCIGDIVKVTSNVYQLNLMNGDSGIIVDVNPNPGASGYPEILVQFKSGQSCKFDVTYDPDGYDTKIEMGSVTDNYVVSNNPTLSLLTLGYATTVHSAQGDEKDFCLIYLAREDKVNTSFINFNLLYTAITRAGKMCFVIGDIQTFDLQCTASPPYRVDNLAERIKVLVGTESPQEHEAKRSSAPLSPS